MKIVALRIQPIARVLAILYALFGMFFWIADYVDNAPYITLPLGVIGPLIHLNFNFNLPRSTDLTNNALLLLGSVVSYALSGWLSGTAAVICFNIVAKWRGGIDADFISFRPKPRPEAVLGS